MNHLNLKLFNQLFIIKLEYEMKKFLADLASLYFRASGIFGWTAGENLGFMLNVRKTNYMVQDKGQNQINILRLNNATLDKVHAIPI